MGGRAKLGTCCMPGVDSGIWLYGKAVFVTSFHARLTGCRLKRPDRSLSSTQCVITSLRVQVWLRDRKGLHFLKERPQH